MGALIALCVPGGAGEGTLALGVMEGVAEASAASGCPVVGGDVSEATGLVVAVTVLGAVEEGGPPPVSRSGARPGDVLLVTGPCGGSAAGLRELRAGVDRADDEWSYRRPVARLAEGALARVAGAHAMIDVSDGLSLDLHRLADASEVGFDLSDVPVAAGATLEEALGGGEDYELVIAASRAQAEEMRTAFDVGRLRPPLQIGAVVGDARRRTVAGEPLARLGWEHTLG